MLCITSVFFNVATISFFVFFSLIIPKHSMTLVAIQLYNKTGTWCMALACKKEVNTKLEFNVIHMLLKSVDQVS